jgi:cysteine desulfurase / selenocysteine lyase
MTRTAAEETPRSGSASFDVHRVREDFPILSRDVNGKPLVYLDNAATTQKPQSVINTVLRYYAEENSNIHRGVHYLSGLATERYESARLAVRAFLNAAHSHEIIFTRGTTEAINLVAQTFGRRNVQAGDDVLITAMEHHSNIVPWQMLCEEKGARLRVAPINDAGELLLEEFERLLTPRTRIVAATHVSNALGTVNPIRRMIEMAHRRGIPVLVDGAQAVAHHEVDVQALDCDFYAFSGHKLYGPTGIGVLYGKTGMLEAMPPYQGGGDMIRTVTFEKTEYNELPYKFEAGTPNIAGAIALGEAVRYVSQTGIAGASAHEAMLLARATEQVSALPGVRLIGTAAEKSAVLSFVLEGIHPHDVGTILDSVGVAVRAGHHCAQPVMDRFQVPATTRASFALYNTAEEVDALTAGIRKAMEIFG